MKFGHHKIKLKFGMFSTKTPISCKKQTKSTTRIAILGANKTEILQEGLVAVAMIGRILTFCFLRGIEEPRV